MGQGKTDVPRRERGPGDSPYGPRPTYTEELGTKICDLLVDGNSLKQIQDMPGMPHKSTILHWLKDNEDFYKMYYLARQLQAEQMADELIAIADDGSNDFMDKELESGRTIQVVDHEHIARSRVRIDTRKFLLMKLHPKIYGEKIAVDHQGAVSAQLVISDGGGAKPGADPDKV